MNTMADASPSGFGSLTVMQGAAVHELDEIKATILKESPFGEVRIRDVRAHERADFDDGEYVQVSVYADDPPAGSDTWPVLDVFRLKQRVLQLATESDVDLPQIVVDVYPRDEDEEADGRGGRDSLAS